MCSSQIKAQAVSMKDSELRLLERCVERALVTAMGLGTTAIVTNAHLSWVRESAARYMPAVLPLLASLDVLSARQRYEARWPGDPLAWKQQAYRDVVDNLLLSSASADETAEVLVSMPVPMSLRAGCCAGRCDSSTPGAKQQIPIADPRRAPAAHPPGACCISENDLLDIPSIGLNLVVFGDSAVDIQAAQSATLAMSVRDLVVKTVKLKEQPTVPELLGELRAVVKELSGLVAEERSCSKRLVYGGVSGWNVQEVGMVGGF